MILDMFSEQKMHIGAKIDSERNGMNDRLMQ